MNEYVIASVIRFYGISIDEAMNQPQSRILKLYSMIDAMRASEFNFLANAAAYGNANAKGREKLTDYYRKKFDKLISHLRPSKDINEFLKGLSSG